MYWTNILIGTFLFFYVIVCVLMALVIMMQRSKQEGLGAAFGGGFTESVWGAQTSQVLVKATVVFAALFFILSISLARLYSHKASIMENGSPVQKNLLTPLTAAPLTPEFPTNSFGQPVVPTASPMTATPAPASTIAPATAAPVKPAK